MMLVIITVELDSPAVNRDKKAVIFINHERNYLDRLL